MSDTTLSTLKIIQDLRDQGFSVSRNFFPATWANAARSEILEREADFQRAGIGKLNLKQIADDVRKDKTLWWEMSAPTIPQKPYVEFFSQLKLDLNRELFLGLWDIEGHYAIYEEGAFYKKHLDRFKNDSKRTVSMVTFFNPDWDASNGGNLVIEHEERRIEVLPEAGTIVVFLSDSVPHEVTETRKRRFSFAGWYRTR